MRFCPGCHVAPSEGVTRVVFLATARPSGLGFAEVILGPQPIEAWVCDCGAIFEKAAEKEGPEP